MEDTVPGRELFIGLVCPGAIAFMTAAHHRKVQQRWMMVLQGFIRHTTPQPSSCELEIQTFAFSDSCPLVGLAPSLLLSRMTEGAAVQSEMSH